MDTRSHFGRVVQTSPTGNFTLQTSVLGGVVHSLKLLRMRASFFSAHRWKAVTISCQFTLRNEVVVATRDNKGVLGAG